VFFAQSPLPYLQRAFAKWFGLGIFAFGKVDVPQIVQEGSNYRMLFTERFFAGRYEPNGQRFCLGILALLIVHSDQGIEALW
jgi:hypothetical protein